MAQVMAGWKGGECATPASPQSGTDAGAADAGRWPSGPQVKVRVRVGTDDPLGVSEPTSTSVVGGVRVK